MWLLVLMSGKWYAKDFVDEDGLRDGGVDDIFNHVNNGNVVSVTDDLETWCDEMKIDIESVERV